MPQSRYRIEWSSVLPLAELEQMIRDAAREAGIATAQLAAIIYIESRGDPNRVNPSDPSYGLGQIMVPTAKYYADAGDSVTPQTLVSDPALNLKCAARFLAELAGKYAGRFDFGEWAQAYNVGEPKFDKGIRNSGYGAKLLDTETGSRVFLGPGQLASVFAGEF